MAFEILISDTADTQDTVNLIISTINKHQHSKFVQEYCRILKPEQTEDFLKRLFDSVCHYIKYERDPSGHERIKTPKRLFADAFNGLEGGDCKKMSTAIASILKCSGMFEPLLKVISYDGKTWEHIYVITKLGNTWYTLDPVNDCKFNSEIPHKNAIVYNLNGNSMNLSLLGNKNPNSDGIVRTLYHGVNGVNTDIDNVSATLLGNLFDSELGGCNLSGEDQDELVSYYEGMYRPGMSGMGALLPKLASKLKAVVKKVTTGVKQVNPASVLMRNAFLGILRLGKALEHTPIKMQLAHKMAAAWQKDPAKVKAMWAKWGGDPDSLKKAIIAGSGTQITGMKGNFDNRTMTISGLGEVTIATITAAIVAATPILLASKSLLNELGVVKAGSKEDVAVAATVDAGVDAHNTDGSLPTFVANALAVPGAIPGSTGSNVTLIALGFIFNDLPLYISIPVIAYTLYHTRNTWIPKFSFITNLFTK